MTKTIIRKIDYRWAHLSRRVQPEEGLISKKALCSILRGNSMERKAAHFDPLALATQTLPPRPMSTVTKSDSRKCTGSRVSITLPPTVAAHRTWLPALHHTIRLEHVTEGMFKQQTYLLAVTVARPFTLHQQT